MKLLCLMSIVIVNSAFAGEAPVCKKCLEIRKYNAEHPENNYFYYDDYVKDQTKKKGEADDKNTALKEKKGK